MLTSLEIAKILRDQKRKEQKGKSGFDAALCGLGITRELKKTRSGK